MRHKKGRARRVIFWALIIFGTSFCFFWAKDAALAARGYQAIGGEWLLWLLPGMLWVGIDTAREIHKLHREGRADGKASKDLQ